MAWILLEGLDRSGKSSLAEYYKDQGYEVVHMEAPDKKYFDPKYGGESYLEEIVRLYSEYEGKDVVFDRTVYGELIWPNIFGREALLNEEDLEYLGHMEKNNEASKILMFDSNTEAHWQRCVDNKEPLSRQQFGRANVFYERLAHEYGFIKKELWDFPEIVPEGATRDDSGGTRAVSQSVAGVSESDGDSSNTGSSKASSKVGGRASNSVGNDGAKSSSSMGSAQEDESIEAKLERANAIRVLLQSKIVKKKGEVYDDLDEAIRGFLQSELDNIFKARESEKAESSFSDEEIAILKSLAQRVQEKAK